jgi:hypothetical protein
VFEILSLVFGGVLRLVPSVLEYFDAKNKREHEKDMYALEMDKIKIQADLNMQISEQDAIKEASVEQTKRGFIPTGRGWIDWLLALTDFISATVRPVLTYWYCLVMYGTYKVASYLIMTQGGADWKNAVTMLWTPADYSIMLSIIGFWFVDRALRKIKEL